MFKWLNKQGVESSKGYVVQSVDRFTIEYRENGKIISINIEDGCQKAGKQYEVVQASSFANWDDGAPIPYSKQKEIIQNFKDAMDFQEISIIVE